MSGFVGVLHLFSARPSGAHQHTRSRPARPEATVRSLATFTPVSQAAADAPQLSVVIPTLGRSGHLRRALERLEDQRGGARYEVIVVVDAQDREPELVDDAIGNRPYPVTTLRAQRPGASSARNRGWRAARSPLILFMDDDVLAGPRLLAEHLAWHRRDTEDEVGVLGHIRWARQLHVTPFMRWLERGVQFDYPRIRGIDAGWGRFYTANVSVKRRMLERTGGFDADRLPFGYEDLDLAYRMSLLGFRLLYNRRAVAEHLHPMDLDFWKQRVVRLANAERQFVRMNPGIEPYYYELFSRALEAPPASGRGLRLAGIVPRWVPWVGRRVWMSADLSYRQALAPHFLAAWEGQVRSAE